MISRARNLKLRYRVLVAVLILLAPYSIEYPLVFQFGYWSWGAAAHKSVDGALVILNLLIAQFVTKRLGFFGGKVRLVAKK